MTRWLLVLVLVGCKSSSEAPAKDNGAPKMTVEEVKRSRDACEDFQTRACACAASVPAAKPTCDQAKATNDAMKIAIDVGANSDTAQRDALDAQRNVRKAVSSCVEESSKLATLGCP